MSAMTVTEKHQAQLDEFRVRLVEAAGARIRQKDEAKRIWRQELRRADRGLVDVIHEAREYNVPWSEIARATGIARQNLALLIDRTKGTDG